MDNKQMEEIKRHFGVVTEGIEQKIQQVSEGVANVDEKLERFRTETREDFKEVKSMIKFSYAELDRRMTTVEHELFSLKARVRQIEVGKK